MSVPVVTCRACEGMGFRGAGSAAQPCHDCGGRGRRRAQLVLTVVNVDSGAVASASVVPEVVEPVPAAGAWRADLMPWVWDLAGRVGVVALRDASGRPVDGLSLHLPDASDACVADALAGKGYRPWRVFLGQAAAPDPPDPGLLLGKLCHLADLLCLDLVIEARRTRWSRDDGTGLWWAVRYEVPGAGVPADQLTRADDLRAAVLATPPEEALAWLGHRSRDAPAYWVAPGPPPTAPPTVDLDQVERRVVRDCAGADGAHAVWRDGAWHHTTLRVAGQTLQRGYEPPPPSWIDSPIPSVPCPDLGRHCPGCRGSGRIHLGAVLTVTDLARRVAHVNWRPSDDRHADLVATQPGGKPVMQVSGRFRLRAWADAFGVSVDDLYDLDCGLPAGQHWHDGHVTLLWSDLDPAEQYLVQATAGRPAARILIRAAAPQAPPLPDLIRLAEGLDLATQITVQDLRHNAADPLRVHGVWWDVALAARQRPVTTVDRPLCPTLAAATANCLAHLDNAVCGAVPDDPDQPVGVPQQPTPADPPDPEPALRRLAAQCPGTPIMARIDRAGCGYYAADGDGGRPITVPAP